MKRKCGKCRAYQSGKGCELGYETKIIRYQVGYEINRKPVEECPKPLTYEDYLMYLRFNRGGI